MTMRSMTIEEAIKTAIEFESKVHRTYLEAKTRAKDPIGQRVFRVLAEEEREHISYLQSRLKEWQKTGQIEIESLQTAVPAKGKIEAGARQFAEKVQGKGDLGDEVKLLQQALQAEKETSTFYRKMVAELPGEGQELFARFVEIEEGHLAIVQAELDSVQGMGFWFDMQEFQLEAE